MAELCVIGVDPGATAGLCRLLYRAGEPAGTPVVVQCSGEVLIEVFCALLPPLPMLTLVQVETFVTRRQGDRNSRAAKTTRDQITELRITVERLGDKVRLYERNAGLVKPWATLKRLENAGLAKPTVGMPHARDAARHALFVAVKDGGVRDPLSRRTT